MSLPMEMLAWALRGFGVFWIVAGIFTLHQARKTAFMDQVLNALRPEQPENPLVTRFLYLGGALTLASGAALATASAWSPLMIGGLVLSQAGYFALQFRRRRLAQDEETRAEATIAPQTRNAFIVSLAVWALSWLAFGREFLRWLGSIMGTG